MLKDLLLRNRSYRRFEQEVRISEEELTELVGLTCLCASARNAQALKYVIVHEEEKCAEVFPQLAWAGYLKDWDGPEEGERPAAYLIQLLDTRIVENCLCDDGIQAQTILLGAVEKGWGGCIIKAFRRFTSSVSLTRRAENQLRDCFGKTERKGGAGTNERGGLSVLEGC